MSNETDKTNQAPSNNRALDRRNLLLGTSTLVATATLTLDALAQAQKAAPAAAPAAGAATGRKPNILVIFGDDIGQTNISAYSFGLMGYRTPNIDRIAREGMMFTDYYAELHGGALVVHYRPMHASDRPLEGRHAWRYGRPAST